METLLSVDLGTTGCKAALCSEEGLALGTSYIEYPLIHLGPSFVEQDAALWWSLTVRAIQEATDRSGVSGHSVRAVSISSQGISFVPISRAGEVLRNAISWLDTRATAEAAAIRAQFDDARLFQITGKRPSAAYVLPKLLWLRANEPALYRSTFKFLMAHDYLVYKLCEATVTDFSMAGGSLLLDLHSLDWSDELLATFDINREQLPDLAWAGTVAGELQSPVAESLGLRPGIPVVVGGQDQKCAALGAAIRSGVATVSLGTASAISCLTERPVLDVERRIPTFPFVLPGYWDLEGVVSTAGAAFKWIRNTFFPTQSYASLDELAKQAPPGAKGVQFYPHLVGAASPLWQVEARGVVTGLSLATSRADIVRSVLEGVAFQIRSNLEVIESITAVEELILFGGGAKSELWANIIAEVTGKPVRMTEMADVANWGACILAGIGTDLFGDGMSSWPSGSLSPTVVPTIHAVQQYDDLYREYLRQEQDVVPGIPSLVPLARPAGRRCAARRQ